MPGRCPSCNQTYTDESLTFCPNDGTPLVREAPGAYNQPPGMGGGQAPGGGYPPPPPQQGGGYYAGAPGAGGGQQPPPPPGWQQQPPYGQQQQPPPYGQQYAPQYGSAPASSSKMPLIIGLLALVLIGGGIGLYFLLRGDSSETANTNNNNGAVATTSPRVPSTSMTPSTTTTTTTTTTGRTYSDDEKHKLFQAVGITKDNDLIIEVAQKIGIVDSRGNPKENFQTFVQEHYTWAQKNMAWVQDHLDASKAREYVMANK